MTMQNLCIIIMSTHTCWLYESIVGKKFIKPEFYIPVFLRTLFINVTS